MKTRHLTTQIANDEMQILVGIDSLAFAADHSDTFNPFDPGAADWIQKWKVTNSSEFTIEVLRAMNREGEDGSTPLTRFLDQMVVVALDDGAWVLRRLSSLKITLDNRTSMT